jgi:hypothetical protein
LGLKKINYFRNLDKNFASSFFVIDDAKWQYVQTDECHENSNIATS